MARTKISTLTESEYEEAYREALLSIPNAMIGEPYLRNGTRYCPIYVVALTDQQVFGVAWGEDVAQQIQRARARRSR